MGSRVLGVMSDENRDSAADGDAVWTAMARAMAGEAAPGEHAAFRRELDADPRRAALFAAVDGALRPLAADARPGVDVEAALSAVLARRDAGPALVRDESPRPARVLAPPPSALRPSRWRSSGLLRMAAVLALVVGGALMWRMLSHTPAVPTSPTRYSTTVGTRHTVQLPDGSTAQLAPLSHLDVSGGYGAPERTVTLSGEAYFEVRHDAAHPFVVRTATAEVRDLGTTFSVSSGGPAGARVVVTSGSVSLRASAGRDTAVLRAGDRGGVAAGQVTVERGAATDDDVAWTHGRLVFRDAPVAEVAAQLRRWYGITLVVRDPVLARRHLTASFGTETGDEAVRVVAAALGGQVQRRGDTAAVVPAGAGTP